MSAKLAGYSAIALAIALLFWSVYSVLTNIGDSRCETRHKAAYDEAAALDFINYKAAVDWGGQISAKLAAAQRQISDFEKERLSRAYSIVGNCPASLGLLVQSASSGNNQDMPSSAGASIDPAATIAASVIGENVAINYSRHEACIKGFNALIDYHKGRDGNE
jgi:hypothetical protein